MLVSSIYQYRTTHFIFVTYSSPPLESREIEI